MSIKVKKAGAYADAVGVFHKRAGVYQAVEGVFVKAGGVYGRADGEGGAPAPPPMVTVIYDPDLGALTITSTAAGFIRWAITTSPAATPASIVSGAGAVASGSISTFPGTIGQDIDTSSLTQSTDYWAHVVLTSNGSDSISAVASDAIPGIAPPIWYETDALFVWDSVADTDTAQINPAIGGALALTHGAAATYSSGLWDFNATRYAGASGMSAASNFGAPLLFAAVLERGDQASAYFALCKFGAAGAFAQINLDALNVRAEMYNASTKLVVATTLTNISQKKVVWGYFNGIDTLTAGANQSDSGSVVDAGLASGSVGRDVRIGGSASGDSKANHGSVQYVRRAGMTLADAKAIVAKMQAHHGIVS